MNDPALLVGRLRRRCTRTISRTSHSIAPSLRESSINCQRYGPRPCISSEGTLIFLPPMLVEKSYVLPVAGLEEAGVCLVGRSRKLFCRADIWFPWSLSEKVLRPAPISLIRNCHAGSLTAWRFKTPGDLSHTRTAQASMSNGKLIWEPYQNGQSFESLSCHLWMFGLGSIRV